MEALDDILSRLNKFQDNPAFFLYKQQSYNRNDNLKNIKDCFQLMTSRETLFNSEQKNTLKKLFIDGFDDEQIWQQFELWNNNLPSYIPVVTELLCESSLKFPCLHVEKNHCIDDDHCSKSVLDNVSKEEENNKYEENEDEKENDKSSECSETEEFSDTKSVSKKRKREGISKKSNGSVVDDDFFKLDEMEQFLEDAENEDKHAYISDDIDYFSDMLTDSEEEEIKYNDFFKGVGNDDDCEENLEGSDEQLSRDELSDEDGIDEGPNEAPQKKVRFSLGDETNSSSDSESEVKTDFLNREAKLKQRMEKLQEENLAEKPWFYKGEASATDRPKNAILEEVLEVDFTKRPTPVITEKVTNTLEDIIIKRIRDSAFDDVERKVKPVHVPRELKKELVLNQEKSKHSLAEIYEQEFLKQKPTTETEEENKICPEKEKIKRMMKSVFHKLDTLSNFHYNPKPASAELEIVSNLPAISMEEVTPAAMSDANLLAPQEIAGEMKKTLLGKDEKTKTDKKRERRKKKAFLSKKYERMRAKEKSSVSKVLKSKNVSLVNKNSDSNLKSSTAFFNKLQEDSELGKKVKPKEKKKK